MDQATVLAQLPALRRYARTLTGNAWAADDLVQDTLERACRKWHLWRPGTDLRAWLFTLMLRVFLNQRRAAWATAVAVPLAAEHNKIAGTAARPDLALDLQRCLALLPPDQRATLLLVTLEDTSYAQAAQMLGVAVGTVMSRLSRARSRLRQLMGGSDQRAPSASARGPQATVTPLHADASKRHAP